MSTEIQSKKQWDTQTGTVTAEGYFGTAISDLLLPELHKQMEGLEIYRRHPNIPGLTYAMLKALVNYLHKNGYDASTLNESVARMLADAVKSSISRLQQLMNSLAPAYLQGPVSGVWSTSTQELYISILHEFGIPFRERDNKMIELIKTIASRATRVRSDDQLWPADIKRNYYFIIDNKNYQYELKETEKEAILVDPQDQRELFRFNMRSNELGPTLDRFCPWFMLLNLNTSTNYNDLISLFLFSASSGDFALLRPATKGDFVIDPDGMATRADLAAHLRLSVMRRERSTEIELVGIFLYNDYTMSHAFPTVEPIATDGTTIDADPRHFFYGDAGNAINNPTTRPLQKADFLKIFIIKKDPDKGENDRFLGRDVNFKNLFNHLVTLEKERLLGTVTIGLELSEAKEEPWQQKQKPVLTLKQLRETVNRLVQTKPVTDFDDIQKNRWGRLDKRGGKILTATVSSKKGASYPVELFVIWEDLKSRKTGNVAFILHNTFEPTVYYEKIKDGMATFSFKAEGPFTVGAYTDDDTELELDLNKIEGAPKSFHYHEPLQQFKDIVLAEYRERPILVPDDLQKSRWGGQSKSGGVEIKASVRKAGDSFRTTVTIDASKLPAYTGLSPESIAESSRLSLSVREAALFCTIVLTKKYYMNPLLKEKPSS